jgi:hypothetical protein
MSISVRDVFRRYGEGHTPENQSMAVSRQFARSVFQNQFGKGETVAICLHMARNAESLFDSARAVNQLERDNDWDGLAELSVKAKEDVAMLALLALERNRRWIEIRQAALDAKGETGSMAIEMLISDNKLDELHFIKKEGCHPTTRAVVERGIRNIEEHIEQKIGNNDIGGLLHMAKSRLGTLNRELEALGGNVGGGECFGVPEGSGLQRIIARSMEGMDENKIIELIGELEGKGTGVQHVAKALYEHQDSEMAMRLLRKISDKVKKAHLLEGAMMYVRCAIEEEDLAKLIRIARGIEREFEAE